MNSLSLITRPVFLIVFLVLSFSAPGKYSVEERTTENESIIIRIEFENQAELNQLVTRLDIWEVNHAERYLVAYVNHAEYVELISAGYPVSIDQELTSKIDKEIQLLPGQTKGIPGFPCYRTVEETYFSLSELAAAHPKLASWIDIGDSWRKSASGGAAGYDIQTLVLTNKNHPGPKPRFYLMASVHAREYATAELAARFAEYLVENYDQNADITWLLDYFEVHITPIANPDGRKIAEQGVYWRKNINNTDGCLNPILWGTDLNRNSSFKWGGAGASQDACYETYRGSSPASETETRAIQDYVSSIFVDQRGPADADPAAIDSTGVFITLHSYGDLIFYPWAWTAAPAPNQVGLRTLARKFGFFNDYQVCQSGETGCLYQVSGNSDDWAYGQLGLPAYTFELGTTFFESCYYFEVQILPDQIPALLYAFKAARLPYQNPAGPESIDLKLSAQHLVRGTSINLSFTADDSRYYSAGWGQEPSQPIAAARYSLDAPTWVSGTQTVNLQPNDGVFDSPREDFQITIDTDDLALGRHTIFVESQDAAGNWGVPSAQFFWVSAAEFEAEITPEIVYGSASPPATLVYNFEISNLGIHEDTFDIQIAGNNWPAVLSDDAVGPLAPRESTRISVETTIPESAIIGEQDLIILVAASRGNPDQFTHAQITNTASPPRIFLPHVAQ